MKPFKHLAIKLLLFITIVLSCFAGIFSFGKPQKALALNCSGTSPANFSCPKGYSTKIYQTTDDATGTVLDYTCICIRSGVCPDGYHECMCAPPGQVALPGTERTEACCKNANLPGFECTGALFISEGEVPGVSPEDVGAGFALKVKVDDDTCPGSTPEKPIIRTAIGCIPTDPSAFIGWVFKLGTFLGGGIAFLLMAWGTFLTMTSAGDPEKLKQGKDIIVSAISGLLFIIFAVFLLRLIGVDILGIPGFQ